MSAEQGYREGFEAGYATACAGDAHVLNRLAALHPHPDTHPEPCAPCTCMACMYNAGVRAALIAAFNTLDIAWPEIRGNNLMTQHT